MSTIHEAAPAETDMTDEMTAAVEEQMGRLMVDLGGSLGVLLISLGTRSGLWAALADAGPLTAEQVAERVTVDPPLVREWLRAQAAGGYLDYRAVDDTFSLPDPVAAAVLHGPGGPLVEACVSILSSIVQGFADFSAAFGSGRGFAWHQRTLEHWHGVDALTRTTMPTELIVAAIDQLPEVALALRGGGSVLDVGCGYGAPTLGIADSYPTAQVFGVDYHDVSIMHARAAGAESQRGNVRFEVAAATELPGDGYDLITFFDSLHDMGDPRGALSCARASVAATGAVLLFEPLGADHVQDNLNPSGRMFYAISTLACTPTAVSQRTATSSEPLGAQAGEKALRALADEAGFTTVRRLDLPAPLNLILELRP
jgi:Methyltransferase domain